MSRTPIKNRHVQESRLDSGDLLLTWPVPMRPWMAALVRRFSGNSPPDLTRKLQLDALGTEVWELLDGTQTVKQIIHHFARRHQLLTREAEVSVTQFLRQLGQRGLIGMK